MSINYHGDGESLAVTDLELMRVALERDCPSCGQLLLPCPDFEGERVCPSCGRSTFQPGPVEYIEEPNLPRDGALARAFVQRTRPKRRDKGGLPEGGLAFRSQRFIR